MTKNKIFSPFINKKGEQKSFLPLFKGEVGWGMFFSFIFIASFTFLISVLPAHADFWSGVYDRATTGTHRPEDNWFAPSDATKPDRGLFDDLPKLLDITGGLGFDQSMVERVSSNEEFFQVAFGRIIGLIFSFVSVIFLALMIYAGFLWMTARGNPEQVDKAKDLITKCLIGLVIVFAAFALTYTVGYIYFRVTSPPHVQTFLE